MHETGCPPTASKSKLRFESVDFANIPGQSKLFLQYQTDPLSLKKYYPNAVRSHTDVADRVTEVLANYRVDRNELCEIIAEQNRRFGAGGETFDSIHRLRQNDTVAVLTGQQAGLLTGPLYTIYKILSAIKMAQCLRDRGFSAVPVFWAATEDHDFDEISRAYLLNSLGEQAEVSLDREPEYEGRSVGSIPISNSFAERLKNLLDAMPDTEFTQKFSRTVESIWTAGRTIGEAFCADVQSLFSKYGLIVVDPLDSGLKRLVAPIYREAARHSDEIVDAIVARSGQLEADGFQPQVLVTPDYFPLFYHTDDGLRRSVRRTPDGKYRVLDTKIEFDSDAIGRLASAEPERFSPGVMLRPVVQDYLFPTVCYFGGGAEIAYFAQNSEAYRILDRPVTTILHRQSFTVVEARHARAMEKYDLEFDDLYADLESILPNIVARFVNPSSVRLFADAEENINTELHRLDQDLSRIDPTLADNLAKRRRKILYHIESLRKKFYRVQIERNEIVNRQLRSLFTSLWSGGLQERTLSVGSFTCRYGPYFIDWLYESTELEERGHRLLYL